MPVKRELCRYFQRGSCQYGDSCRYSHAVQQQPNSNRVFGGGGSSGQQQQQQKPNPFGFGVQSNNNNNNSQQPKSGGADKPFENKWSRSPATTATATASSRRSDNQPQANHECTNPEACLKIINEDFERERPLWKLTCYGHSRNLPCDIGGDISYEELRAAAYDDAKRGLNLPSIVERERNLVNSKSIEFDNLRKPRAVPLNSTASQSPFSSATANAFFQPPQSSGPPSLSSFSQFGTALNSGFGQRPSAPANGFSQPSLVPNSGNASSGFGTNTPLANVGLFPNSGNASSGFGTSNPLANVGSLASQSHNRTQENTFTQNIGFGNQISSSTMPAQFPCASSSQLFSTGQSSASNPTGQLIAEVQSPNNIQLENTSGDTSIWMKKKWMPGEVPEEEPPEALVLIDL